jgi:hypothetical protein
MQKQLILSSLALAFASATLTYDVTTDACFEYTTDPGVAKADNADRLKDVTVLDDTFNTAGTEYDHAYDVTLSYSGYSTCFQVLTADWTIEWTVNTADSSDSTPAFQVNYEEWADDGNGFCTGSVPTSTLSSIYTNAGEMTTSDAGVCAYDVLPLYTPEALSGSQVFTLYYDSATTTAASALILAGVSSMFF